MFNSMFTMVDGTGVYPSYLSADQRKKLKELIGARTEVMWCSCRSDKKLFYRISEDLRFYPEHIGYIHDECCSRYHAAGNKRKTAMVRSDDETTTVFLKFNPSNFTIPTSTPDDNTEDESTSCTNEEELSSDTEENELIHIKKLKADLDIEKEPKFSLESFIRSVNYDAFSERAINNKPILSGDYFSNALLGHLNHIFVSGTRKSVRALTLEDDGVRFFYGPFAGCDIKGAPSESFVSYNVKIKGNDNKVYSLFTFGSIYEKAQKAFYKQYGIEPDSFTFVAGFQYYPLSKYRKHYKVIGRMHLFQVSKHGIYCSSIFEQHCYNSIVNYVISYNKRNGPESMRFYIPAEEEKINGIIEIKGYPAKGMIIFPSKRKAKEVYVDKSLYETLLVYPDIALRENALSDFIRRIKGHSGLS